MNKSTNVRSSSADVAEVQEVSISNTLDDSDLGIIKLLVAGHNNQQIANEMKIPLSTVQRRTRRILKRGM